MIISKESQKSRAIKHKSKYLFQKNDKSDKCVIATKTFPQVIPNHTQPILKSSLTIFNLPLYQNRFTKSL